ncbi:MAG: MCE family protein [Nitrospirae bacterium]|nr:MCE family protein [Nitrospirota bacterium]
MRNLSAELKVGIFAIIVILILSYMTLKVGILSNILDKGYRLHVAFDNISGLDENSRIKIAGVDSGIVKKIELKDGKAELTLLIRPENKIYENAKASLRMTGLLGDKYLSLTVGTSDHALLKDGDYITHIDPSADMDVLATELTAAGANVGTLAGSLGDILQDPEKKAISEVIHNLQIISEDLKVILAENKEPLHVTLANFEEFSKTLAEKGPGLIASLERVAAKLDEKAPGLVDDLQQVAGDLKVVIEENRFALKDSVQNIRDVSASVNKITTKLEKGEGTIGKLLKEQELYDSLNKVAGGAEKAIDVTDKLRTYMDFRADYSVRGSDWRGYFDLTLQPRPDKYYILGVVKDPNGSVETTVTDINGATSTKEEVASKFEFTAQFAKRFENLALRIGMTETTLGVGSDYYFNDDIGRVRLDIWDFNADEVKAERAHAKVGVDYKFFKYMFVSGGIDNFFNEDQVGAYIGGGLMFEDEDFKYIFGKSPNLSLP